MAVLLGSGMWILRRRRPGCHHSDRAIGVSGTGKPRLATVGRRLVDVGNQARIHERQSPLYELEKMADGAEPALRRLLD
jgi:hypothetical protein